VKLRANGVEINYALAGPAGAPVVTLSHSIAADLTMWDPTLPALTERYRVWFTPGFAQVRPDVVARTLAMIARTSPRGFAGCAAAIRDLDLTERLSGIRLPTLLIVGEQDEATPPIASQLMQALIKDAELVVLPGAAHLSIVEQPEAFNRALAAFLARIDTA